MEEGGAVPRVLPYCSVCGERDADLEHVVCRCPGLKEERRRSSSNASGDQLRLEEVMQGVADGEELRKRVRYFGRICEVVASGFRRP